MTFDNTLTVSFYTKLFTKNGALVSFGKLGSCKRPQDLKLWVAKSLSITQVSFFSFFFFAILYKIVQATFAVESDYKAKSQVNFPYLVFILTAYLNGINSILRLELHRPLLPLSQSFYQ